MAKHNRNLDPLTLRCPAKLNLFLRITGRRNDGYHELQTLFQLLEHSDYLTLQPESSSIRLLTPLDGVAEEDNLVIRAAQLLKRETGSSQGAAISLKKRLPVGGGLGGGSSNAASTLLGLNALWKTQLSFSDLAELGCQLGADVPVFVRGYSCLAEGVGEITYPIELQEFYYLVAKPQIEVSTATIFAHPRLTRDSLAIRIAAFFQQANLQDDPSTIVDSSLNTASTSASQSEILEEWIRTEGNDCEAVVRELHPEIDEALRWLNTHAMARLTGTGSCLFARFESREEALAVLTEAPRGVSGFVCPGNNVSVAHKDLASWQNAHSQT